MQFLNLTGTNVKKVALRLEPRVFFLSNESRQIDFSFEKSGASAHIFALFIGSGDDTFEFSVFQNHRKPRTASSLTILGILDGRSKLSSSGLIRIESGAEKTDASQDIRNLILSENSGASASPKLEILADDVSARHASATGMTNPEAVFSLESRGICRPEAEQILAEGLVKNFFDQMRRYTDDPETDSLKREALQKLSSHSRI